MNTAVRFLITLGAMLALGACTALQFSYNNAETVLRYMAWDYFDLDKEQVDSLHQSFVSLREWHRSSELPVYVGLLQTAGEKVTKGVTRADVDWANATLKSNYRSLVERAVFNAAPLLVELKPHQIAALEKKFAKENLRYADQWIGGEEQPRHRKRVGRLVERFEEWTGELSASQRSRVASFVTSHADVYSLRLEDRRRWQREVVALIKRHKIAAELAPSLTRVFTEAESSRSEAYRRAVLRWEADLAGLIVELDATLSAEQRQRVLKRIDRYAEDFRALSGQRRSGGDSILRASRS